ncbi:MAG: hypothetical protein ACRC1W_08290 [Shewanella sp.]
MTENVESSAPELDAPNVETETQNPVDVTPEGTAPEGEEKKQAEPAKTFTQEEVDALVQKRLLKKEREVLRNVQRQQAEEQRRASTERELKREQFTDEDAYLEARLEQLADKKADEKISQLERQREMEKTSEAFLERTEKAIDKYPDFHDVAGNPSLKINEAMVEFIAESNVGPDVAYYLGKNPSTAAKIADMSPIKAARELARIEAEISAKPVVKTSTLPAPIDPIGARGSSAKRLENMSFDEYESARKAMKASWAR